MAKKNKRQGRKSPSVVRANGGAVVSAGLQTQSAERGFNPDYSHVVKDLKRIGFLAGSFILVLIALSFFLR